MYYESFLGGAWAALGSTLGKLSGSESLVVNKTNSLFIFESTSSFLLYSHFVSSPFFVAEFPFYVHMYTESLDLEDAQRTSKTNMNRYSTYFVSNSFSAAFSL